jgi:hypothetical protein
VPPPDSLVVIAGLLAALTAVAAAVGCLVVRGSTAVPAAGWAVAAAAAFGLEAAGRRAGWLDGPAGAAAVRLVVVALAICPAMSLLGAKRPQHGVWQFIVFALGVMLAWPALSAILVRPGSLPDVHLLERWFILLLLVVGWLNFAATRRGGAATLVAAGQVLLARPFLPGSSADVERPGSDCVGAGLVAAGAVLALLQSAVAGFARARPPARPGAGIDAACVALRETFGAAWALRIAERFDLIAAQRGWPCRLSFRGLRGAAAENEAEWQHDADRAFRALARRFVTTAWLARHGCGVREVDRGGEGG